MVRAAGKRLVICTVPPKATIQTHRHVADYRQSTGRSSEGSAKRGVSQTGNTRDSGNSPATSTHGRYFSSGAYRDSDDGKPDFEGYLSPLVIEAYGRYMISHQRQSDGRMRGSDNWQAGMSRDVYMKSLWRHFLDLWLEHRGYESRDGIDEALGGLLFNVCGFWFEVLRERRAQDAETSLAGSSTVR